MMTHLDRDRIPTDRRPLGYWLRAIDRPLRHAMREAFAGIGVTRREWRLLATLHREPATVEQLRAALPPKSGGLERPGRRPLEQVLETMQERGWIATDDGVFRLTAEGERIHDAILANVQTVRARVADGIPQQDYATTMSTLQRIAGNLGWDPATPTRRRRSAASSRGTR